MNALYAIEDKLDYPDEIVDIIGKLKKIRNN
jgi:hypothetical protein